MGASAPKAHNVQDQVSGAKKMRALFRSIKFRLQGHHGTLRLLFNEPAPLTIEWRRIESLLLACGAYVAPVKGDGKTLRLNDIRRDIHPFGEEVRESTIIKTRKFLKNA